MRDVIKNKVIRDKVWLSGEQEEGGKVKMLQTCEKAGCACGEVK